MLKLMHETRSLRLKYNFSWFRAVQYKNAIVERGHAGQNSFDQLKASCECRIFGFLR